MAATTVGFFWHPQVRPGVILFPVWSADTERTRFWSNCIKCLRYIRNILIFWLNLVPQEGLRPERARLGYAEFSIAVREPQFSRVSVCSWAHLSAGTSAAPLPQTRHLNRIQITDGTKQNAARAHPAPFLFGGNEAAQRLVKV